MCREKFEEGEGSSHTVNQTRKYDASRGGGLVRRGRKENFKRICFRCGGHVIRLKLVNPLTLTQDTRQVGSNCLTVN
jgi:hypothetical protein